MQRLREKDEKPVVPEPVKPEKEKIKLKHGTLTPCVNCHSRKLILLRGAGYMGMSYLIDVRCRRCKGEGTIAVKPSTREAIYQRVGNSLEWDETEIIPRR
jgi:hypothetical protein